MSTLLRRILSFKRQGRPSTRLAPIAALAALVWPVLVHDGRATEPSVPLPGHCAAQSIDTPATGAEQGRILFGRNCAHCHGEDARGDEGPNLFDLKKTDARIRQIIQQGIKGEMPKFITKFSEAEVQALIAYLRTLKSNSSVPQ